jgi:hypothetical protein
MLTPGFNRWGQTLLHFGTSRGFRERCWVDQPGQGRLRCEVLRETRRRAWRLLLRGRARAKERHCIATLNRAGAQYPVAGSHPRLAGSTSARYLQRPLRECMALRRNLAREAAIRLRAALCGMPAHRRRSERADPRSGLCSGSSWQCVACRHHWRHNVLIIGKSPLKPSSIRIQQRGCVLARHEENGGSGDGRESQTLP